MENLQNENTNKNETEYHGADNNSGAGIVYETIDELSKRTKLPKSWWYSQTRQTGPGSVPRIKAGKYLRFVVAEVDFWLRNNQKTADQ